MSKMFCTVPEAGALLSLGRWASYEKVRVNDFPVEVIKVGHRKMVPIAALAELLGVPREEVVAEIASLAQAEAAA